MDTEQKNNIPENTDIDTESERVSETENIEKIEGAQRAAVLAYANINKRIKAVPITQQLLLLAAILLLLLGGTITPSLFAFFKSKADVIPAAPIESEKRIPPKETAAQTPTIKPFTDINIRGEAAYVWDVQTQRVLYKKNETEQLPLASVTKLMTALLANEVLDAHSNVIIGQQAVRQDGDSGLSPGEIFDSTTLSDLVLMSSSNDGAYAMAVAAGSLLQSDNPADTFVRAMNIRAEELALHDTYFKNPTGLDISEDEAGSYGSAKDISFLMEYITVHKPNILAFTKSDKARFYNESNTYHDASNTNYYVDKIPGLIGSKTGYTDLAGGNLVIAFDAGLNRQVVITVLGSTRHGRFTDVMTLVAESQKYVTQE